MVSLLFWRLLLTQMRCMLTFEEPFHVLKKFAGRVSDYLVVIYVRKNGEGYHENGLLHEF